MAACTAIVAGLGKFCRWPTNETSASVHPSRSPPDVIPGKGCGMLGAVTAMPVNLYMRARDLLAGSCPNSSKSTSQPLLGYSEQSTLSGTESPTSDDALLPQLLTSSDEEFGVDGKEIITADDRATENGTPVEDVIKCQNTSFVSKQPTRPTKNRGTSAKKENRKATSTQKAKPPFAKPKLSQTHLNDNMKARHGSHAHHEQTASTKQRNTIAKGVLAGPAEKPKPKASEKNSTELQRPSELPREASKQDRHKKNRESQPKRSTESLKPHSGQRMKHAASFEEKTVLPNKPSSGAAPLSIPEMQNTSNKQPLGTATCSTAGQSNAPSQNKPQPKSEARKENTVGLPGKSGIPDNLSAQTSSLKVPAPQTTIDEQPPETGASFCEVPSISPYGHMDEPQPKFKTGAMNNAGLQKKTQLSSKPPTQTVSPKLLAPENTSEKQPLKATTRTTKSQNKSHKLTDRQPKHEPRKKHPVGLHQKTEPPKNLSQSVKQKVCAPKTSKKQPSGTTASSDQEPASIGHRPRSRMQKMSDPSSEKHPVNVQGRTSLRNKSSQRAPSNALAPKKTSNKRPSRTADKSDDAPRNIPSDRPQPIHEPRSGKLPRNLKENIRLPNKLSSQKAQSDAPTPNNTSNKQYSRLAPRSDEVSSYIPSREPTNRPQLKFEQNNKKHPADLQGIAGLVDKPASQIAPGSPQNTSDDQPSQNDAHRSRREHKTPSDSTMVDDSADKKKHTKPKKHHLTANRSQEEPKEDTESKITAGNKVAEAPIDDKDNQQKDSTKETKKQSGSPRDDQAAYVTKPPTRSSEKRKGLKVAGQNSVPGPQQINTQDSQDMPSGKWPHIVSARIEGFGPAVVINARKIEPQIPHSHKVPHKKKSLLDAVHKIMEACAKMTHLLETSSTDDSTFSKAISSSPNSISRKPKLHDDMTTAIENYGTRNMDSEELPPVDENEQNDKNFNSKKICRSNEQMGIKSDFFSWSTGSKTTPPVNLNKPPPRVADQGTQTEGRLKQTKSVATDCTDILPAPTEGSSEQHTGAVISNKAQKALQIDLPKNNVTSLVQLLEGKAQQRGSDEPASPKQLSNVAGMGQGNGVANADITKSDNVRPSAVGEDVPLPFQNNGKATPIDRPKTPPPIKLPNGSPHVHSMVNFFHQRCAKQQDQSEPASTSKGVGDHKPATYHSGNKTEKAEVVDIIKPYQHTGNAESSEMATQTAISNGQGSVLHLNVPRNVRSLVQLLELNSPKRNKTVSYKPASKLARTALQKRTKNDEISRSEDMQAPACHKDQPWPCQRPRMFRRTVSTPKKTRDATFR
ncbi:titin-like [Rhipicephalus sanguineus]|uniref:titin-like n=1 Tax=Rhipicephalus sanguineus TaxID=34632 RepID=UPI0020C442E0|nr:titin-like [Rhipicephalus sanguineus]